MLKIGKHHKDQAPWVGELSKHLGHHEVNNNSALKRWLKSDGTTLGDPSKLPWCGDAVETAVKLTVATDIAPTIQNITPKNPYLARNWLSFGREPCKPDSKIPPFGAITILWRGKRNGTSGHVAFVIACDPAANKILLRGGNQGDTVSDSWYKIKQVLGYRFPYGHPYDEPCPMVDSTKKLHSVKINAKMS